MAKSPTNAEEAAAHPICGIIMPIAAMPGYEPNHWPDVRRVIESAIVKAGMTPQIVSDSFESDVIQSRIINNLYYNPVVVCDVSGLNPNVMFELGMRITFKQPVVIITDSYDSIPFDTKIIEHLGYPRDLHIHKTSDFIEKLADKIQQLHEQKKSNSYTSFIEAFGTFEVLEPTEKAVPAEQLILDRLERIERNQHRMREEEAIARHASSGGRRVRKAEKNIRIKMKSDYDPDLNPVVLNELLTIFESESGAYDDRSRTFTIPTMLPVIQASRVVSERLVMISGSIREMIHDIAIG